jgi:hypothetical protein
MKLSLRKRLLTTLLLAAIGLATFLLTSHSQASDSQVNLTGTISDSMCGAKHMMNGDDPKCVRSCIKNGSQYALIVDDKVYVLQGWNEELDKLAGQKATVTGTVHDAALQVVSVKPAQAVLSANAQSSGDTSTPPPTTIEGLVRDVACPIQNKEATATKFNLKCARDCARLGSPLIILTQDGTLYTPISESMPDHDQRQRLLPFLGKYVRVTGEVYERSGTRAIAIKDIQELKSVHLITDAE